MHCTCVAPACTAATELATAQPVSSWQWMPSRNPVRSLTCVDDLGDPEREHPAVGVAQNGDVGARGDGRVEHPQRGVGVEPVAVEEVLGVEEDPPALRPQERDGVGDHRAVLGDIRAQRALDVAAIGLRDERDDRRLRVEQGADLGVAIGGRPGLAGGAERDERGVPEGQLACRGAGEELGVLGHRPRPAALDVADPQRVEMAGDRELVGDRVADPSRWAPSRSVVSKTWKSSPRGVPAGTVRGDIGAPGGGCARSGNKKDPPRVREVCASARKA